MVALKSHIKMIIAASAVPPRFILSTVNQYSVTILCLNSTLLFLLCDEIKQKIYDVSSLQKIYVSAVILNDAIYEKAKRVLTDISVFNVYGLSETCPRITAQTSDCCKRNSVGKPIMGVEITITDENGISVPNEVRGIIHVKTPSLFSGYVMGEKKYASFYQDWLNTGDVGFCDKFEELHVVGRVDNIIICDAYKVYPADVEKLILQDPLISDCAVSRCTVNGTEVIGCLYVSNRHCSIDIVHRLKEKLARYEIPKRFLRVEVNPHNNRGKID